MDILSYIAMAQELFKIGSQVYDQAGKVIAALQQRGDMTAEERAAFEALMKSDAAKDYAQQQPE